jgi:hypothetical protein
MDLMCFDRHFIHEVTCSFFRFEEEVSDMRFCTGSQHNHKSTFTGSRCIINQLKALKIMLQNMAFRTGN